jgi:hypothetical protein
MAAEVFESLLHADLRSVTPNECLNAAFFFFERNFERYERSTWSLSENIVTNFPGNSHNTPFKVSDRRTSADCTKLLPAAI